ncbi:transposable element Tcb1 transposase [Trichonephila clavipes]|nr:transposable element Tcb1 transposase [Trichonephila clavipes]
MDQNNAGFFELCSSNILSLYFPSLRLSEKKIGGRVGRNQTTVMGICDRWMQEGTTDRRGRSHPPQCTTSQHIESVTHLSVSARIIRRRLQ